jgi:hypothetical protein
MTIQTIRGFDVLILGPLMIWAATSKRQLPYWAKFALMSSGVATIAFNGWNYLQNRELK